MTESIVKLVTHQQGWIKTLRGPMTKYFEGPHRTGNSDYSLSCRRAIRAMRYIKECSHRTN